MTPIDSRSLKLMGAGLVVALASALSLTAFAGDPPAAPEGASAPHGMMGMHGMPHHRGGAEMGSGGLFMMGGRHLDHLLDEVGASDAQRSQVKDIAKAAAADLKAQHEAGRKLHEQAMAVLTAPEVDAAAAEKVRQQHLAMHDQMSKRMTQAMVDIARVLTPEQRAKLAQRMKEHQTRMAERRGEHKGEQGGTRQ